jgi:hypothetical protein
MKILILSLVLMNLANAEMIEGGEIAFESIISERAISDRELEEIKKEIRKQKKELDKDTRKELNKITYKSNINNEAYKARKSCLMTEKTAEECDKLFPVVKSTFKISYEVKNVAPEEKNKVENSDKLKSLVDEEPSPLNSDPIDVDA